MEVLKVTFYKKVHHLFDDDTLEKVEFTHELDTNKSTYDNETDAYDIAVSKGHDPHKNIKFEYVNK